MDHTKNTENVRHPICEAFTTITFFPVAHAQLRGESCVGEEQDCAKKDTRRTPGAFRKRTTIIKNYSCIKRGLWQTLSKRLI